MKLKRPRVDWERLQALERELGFTLPPSVVPERDKERARRAAARKDWLREKKDVVSENYEALFAVIIVLMVFSVCCFGSFEGIKAIANAHPPTPSPLPPHVLVGPSATFLVRPQYVGLGTILCENGEYSHNTIPEGTIVSCKYEQARSFSYPKSDVWRGP